MPYSKKERMKSGQKRVSPSGYRLNAKTRDETFWSRGRYYGHDLEVQKKYSVFGQKYKL